MWVAILVALVMSQTGQGQVGVQAAPEAFHSKAECEAAQAQVEPQVKAEKSIKAYVLMCVEAKKEDFKAAGKDS